MTERNECSSVLGHFWLINLPLNLPWVISSALSFFKQPFPFLICSLLDLRGPFGYSHKPGFLKQMGLGYLKELQV